MTKGVYCASFIERCYFSRALTSNRDYNKSKSQFCRVRQFFYEGGCKSNAWFDCVIGNDSTELFWDVLRVDKDNLVKMALNFEMRGKSKKPRQRVYEMKK